MKRMTSLLVLVVVALMTVVGSAARQSKDTRAETALAAAIKIETIDGKPDAAITAYKNIVQKYPNERVVVAQALVRMGQCYEKLGDRQAGEARKTYQLLVSSYGDQAEVASRARTRLAAMDAAMVGPTGSRMVGRFAPPSWVIGTSADGRFVYLREGFLLPRPRDMADGITRVNLADQTQTTVFPAVTIGAGELYTRVLAPDGNQVAFTLTSPGQTKCAVRVSASIAGPPKPIATLDGFRCETASWSPNSDRLLIGGDSASHGGHDFLLLDTRTGGILWKLGRNADDFDWSMSPVSPDGRFVTLLEPLSNDRAAILVSDSQGGNTAKLERANSVSAAIWTADGRGLLFVDGEPGGRSLFLASVSESGSIGVPQQVKANVGNIGLYHHSADGSLLYSVRPEGTIPTHHLATLDENGVATSISVVPGIQRVCNFGWTSDSKAVVYGARLLKDYGGEIVPCTLLVIRSMVDGSERYLTPGMSEIRRPKFSPDGNSIVAYGRKDGVAGVYIVDAKTGAARLIADAPSHQTVGEDILTAEWSPDGKGLFLNRFTPGGSNRVDRLVYRDLQTGQETDRYVRSGPGRVFGTATSVAPHGRGLGLVKVLEKGV